MRQISDAGLSKRGICVGGLGYEETLISSPRVDHALIFISVVVSR